MIERRQKQDDQPTPKRSYLGEYRTKPTTVKQETQDHITQDDRHHRRRGQVIAEMHGQQHPRERRLPGTPVLQAVQKKKHFQGDEPGVLNIAGQRAAEVDVSMGNSNHGGGQQRHAVSEDLST